MIVGPANGFSSDLFPVNGASYTNILAFKENWVAISGDSVYVFEHAGKQIAGSMMNIGATAKPNTIMAVVISNYYLIIMRDIVVNVFNLMDYSKVQDIELEKGDVGSDMVLNIDSKDIKKASAMIADNIIMSLDVVGESKKKDPMSKLMYLKAIPADKQIQRLLLMSKVNEAQKVFSQNVFPGDENFDQKKEEFNTAIGWALFKCFEFAKSYEFFLQVNYDPREFLALVPDLLDKKDKTFTYLKDLIEQRGTAEKPEVLLQEGTQIITKLVEAKRKYLAEKYDISKEFKKVLPFIYADFPINEYFGKREIILDEMMGLLDDSLMKLYVEQQQLKQIQLYFETTKVMKCDYKKMEIFFKDKLSKDSSCTAHVCLAYLYNNFGNYPESLAIWKTLGSNGSTEIIGLACKEIARLLPQMRDKKEIFEYAKVVLYRMPEDGIKIFTENENLPKFISEDDVIGFFESLERSQGELKEKYLEYLVTKNGTDERFHTLLGKHYINSIQEALKKENKKTVEIATDSSVNKNREKLIRLLKTSKIYNIPALLEEMKGLGMLEEEILLYSKQKMHSEALSSLVELGKQSLDFTKAEQYCLNEPEPLLSKLFGKILDLYSDAKKRYQVMEKDKSGSTIAVKATSDQDGKKQMIGLELYCKNFLKKYAANERMNAEEVLKMLPEDWSLKDQKDGINDESLFQFVALALNDRLGKEHSYKIAKNSAKMHKLNLETDLVKLQRAYAIITPERKCKVCQKKLAGAKSFYVFPNGVIAHPACVKDVTICPVTNINFLKKIYE